MELDAQRLGYTITPYNPPSGAVEQFGYTSRLIAVATGNTDYHFYMQHDDGTWSHKPGSYMVTNKSLNTWSWDIADTGTVLTNSNIRTRANEGSYAGGELRFYIISKDAVIDYPHGSRCCNPPDWPCNHNQSTTKWANISSNLNVVYLSDPTDVRVNVRFIGATSAQLGGAAGVMLPNVTGGRIYTLSNWHLMEDDDYFKNWRDTRIHINTSLVGSFSESRRRGVINHEFGHALKLAHLQEMSGPPDPWQTPEKTTFPAIMQPKGHTSSGTSYNDAVLKRASWTLTSFDKSAIRTKWGK